MLGRRAGHWEVAVIDPGDRWAKALNALGLADAEFLRASQFDSARRAYRVGQQVAKVVLLPDETTSGQRVNDPQGEFAVLKHCGGISGIPGAVAVRSVPDVSALVVTYVPGTPADEVSLPLRKWLVVSFRLSALLARLAARGVSHNDVTPRNILVTPALEVSLVDFDQARVGSRARAFANNFVGIRSGKFAQYSLVGLLRRPLRTRLPDSVVRAYRRIARRTVATEPPFPSHLPSAASNRAIMFHQAWRIATTSDATSPGRRMAYYSLTVDGIYLPGERPWKPRWEQLRGATSLKGKRILELGCNMALFSSFAIEEESATRAMAVDADARILKAADLVTRACNARVELVRQDFDEQGWEDRLASFRPDLVTALSVVQWVTDKDRFLTFLGRFPELLYEGHDPVDIERARLLWAGFDRVELIGESERNRPLLRATRDLD